jgi:hypothetical protein
MQKVLHLGPFAGRTEIAAARLAGAFEQVPDGQALRQPVPVVPAPVQLVHERSERERRIGDAPGDHDVGASCQGLGDRCRAEIRVGEQQALAHARDVGAGVHMGKGFARAVQLIDALGDRVAGDDRDLRFEAFVAERARHRRACAVRVEPAGIHHELHAALRGHWPQLGQHRHAVARIAGARVLLAVLLQDRERQFGKMIRRDVLDAAALDRGAHRAPRIAVKAEPGADADRFHGTQR